jgi:hypothetical protein
MMMRPLAMSFRQDRLRMSTRQLHCTSLLHMMCMSTRQLHCTSLLHMMRMSTIQYYPSTSLLRMMCTLIRL